MTIELTLHILFGAIGLISGFMALFTRKGYRPHRVAGHIYFVSMVCMAISGLYLASLIPIYITMLAALLTFYFVITSWLTVYRGAVLMRLTDIISMVYGIGVLTFGIFLCWRASSGIQDTLGSYTVPAPVYYFFSFMVFVAVLGDIRMVFWGRLQGKYRIMRHLWRMCVTLYIAASSFFTGQEQVFPKSLQGSFYLTIPQLVVVIAMLFWLVRTATTTSKKQTAFSDEQRPLSG